MAESPTIIEGRPLLAVPIELAPTNGRLFPEITEQTRAELIASGWDRIGIMCALVTSEGDIMMLNHTKSEKLIGDQLGPFGETAKMLEGFHQIIYRGLKEELGAEDPTSLELEIHPSDGWVINHWPNGGLNCLAVSFPIFMPDQAVKHLKSRLVGTEEIQGVEFLAPDSVLNMQDDCLRPGTKAWLRQLMDANLLDPSVRGQPAQLKFGKYVADADIPDDILNPREQS